MSLANQVEAYLGAKLGASVRVEGFARRSGGASRETYLFDAHWSEGAVSRQQGYVLRRDPVASLLESDRTHEYRAIDAAARIGIPVPRVCWLELDGRALERPFFIMERVAGMPTPPTFPATYPAEMRARTADDFISLLARIHAADWRAAGFDFLEDPGPGTAAARRAVDLWRGIHDADRIEPHPILARAFGWLERNLPSVERVTLVHGDYRSGNYLHDEDGRITAVLDWEMVHLGDPLEDLGWATMPYWSSEGRAGGLEPEAEMVARYERCTGGAVDRARLRFYQILGSVKMMVISLTGVRNFCQGRSAEPTLAVVGIIAGRLMREIAGQLAAAEG
jgi:aminoglycoside phosphotransferase (APT) family kinase protein